MNLSSEDIFNRGVLLVCGVVFAIPTYFLWKEVVVGHQWPDDYNGWLGLLMCPMFSIASLLYATILYRKAKEADERLKEDMDNNTRRGKTIFIVAFSLIFILIAIQFLVAHIFESEPWETWELIALPLFAIVFIGLIFSLKVDNEKLHNFLTKKGWHWLDRLIFEDAFNIKNKYIMKNFEAGECWLFSEGLAAVKIKNRYGFINKRGDIVIEPKYVDAFGFSDGLAAVEVGRRYGFIDHNGTMVIEPQFGFTTAFTEGLASVINYNDYFIIDKNGNTVVTLGESVSDLESFSGGLAAAEVKSENGDDVDYKYGFVDHSGHMAIEPKFDWVGPFSDGLAVATMDIDGQSGYIDTTGRFVIEPQYEEAENFSEGVAPVKKDGKWSFIDKTGAEVAMLGDLYDSVYPFTEGRSIVCIGEKYGAIDKAGNLIIDFRFDRLLSFSEGLAFARMGDTQGFINTSGVFEIQKAIPKPTLFDIILGRKKHIRW